MQRQSQCRRAGLIERTRNSRQSNLLLGINTSERVRGTRNSQGITNATYTGGGCHLQGNLVVNANSIFPWMQ